jgi:hypothetical protein
MEDLDIDNVAAVVEAKIILKDAKLVQNQIHTILGLTTR